MRYGDALKIFNNRKKKLEWHVKQMGLYEKKDKVNNINPSLPEDEYLIELEKIVTLDEAKMIYSIKECEIEIINVSCKVFGYTLFTLQMYFRLNRLIEQFQKALSNIINATKSILKPFQQNIIDTFTPPAKLFTQTFTHYTHTLSRP